MAERLKGYTLADAHELYQRVARRSRRASRSSSQAHEDRSQDGQSANPETGS